MERFAFYFESRAQIRAMSLQDIFLLQLNTIYFVKFVSLCCIHRVEHFRHVKYGVYLGSICTAVLID